VIISFLLISITSPFLVPLKDQLGFPVIIIIGGDYFAFHLLFSPFHFSLHKNIEIILAVIMVKKHESS